MKRYFLAHDRDMPTWKEQFPGLDYIPLDSHGPAGADWNFIVLAFPDVDPKPNWQPLPSILDSKTTLRQSKVDEKMLTDIGLTGEETAIEVVTVLADLFPPFRP